ncbi:MAG: COX15/CtaA family protein [Gemmataceae bacterium]
MTNDPTPSTPLPGWVRTLAVVTGVAALPVMFLGAQTTTMEVGMVDPQGYRQPWESVSLLFQDLGLGYLVEHGHRLAAWSIGGFVLLLTAVLAFVERRPSVRYWSFGVAVLIFIQAMLGRYRVDLNAMFGKNMALIHGVFAQIVFASIFTLVWFVLRPVGPTSDSASPRLRRVGGIVIGLFLLQILMGAFVRHRPAPLFGRLHLLGAFIVFGMSFSLIYAARQNPGFRSIANWIMALMTIQVILGVEAWMYWTKRLYGITDPGTESLAIHLTRTLHYMFGSFLFSAIVITFVKARLASSPNREVAAA